MIGMFNAGRNLHINKDNIKIIYITKNRYEKLLQDRQQQQVQRNRPPTPDFSLDGSGKKKREEPQQKQQIQQYQQVQQVQQLVRQLQRQPVRQLVRQLCYQTVSINRGSNDDGSGDEDVDSEDDQDVYDLDFSCFQSLDSYEVI